MLLSLDIHHFSIIHSLHLKAHPALNMITGEAGAGKSILLEALSLVLGKRAVHHVVEPNKETPKIEASFDVRHHLSIIEWFKKEKLLYRDQCSVCRIFLKNKRSHCFINEKRVSLSQLKALGKYLVTIHQQHAQQLLLNSDEQMRILDHYAAHFILIERVSQAFLSLKSSLQEKETLKASITQAEAQKELLIYQVNELTSENIDPLFIEQLEKEHQAAATANDRLKIAQRIIYSLSENEPNSSLAQLNMAITQLKSLLHLDHSLTHLLDLFIDIQSLLTDANQAIYSYQETLSIDPVQLDILNNHLSLLHDLARKHQISLHNLPHHLSTLQQRLMTFDNEKKAYKAIILKVEQNKKNYQKEANILHNSRQKHAKILSQLATQQLQCLGMKDAQFFTHIEQKKHKQTLYGFDDIHFKLSPHLGQSPQKLHKIASGGELSRISLALTLITGERHQVPCIIFDEVDEGLGGETAESVGFLLKQLSQKKQVFCITHQAQIAACGDYHWLAIKKSINNTTLTHIVLLNDAQRRTEIARMLGGRLLPSQSEAYAQSMLDNLKAIKK
jgi:DNA repair protein RecN (Recombination protein N)